MKKLMSFTAVILLIGCGEIEHEQKNDKTPESHPYLTDKLEDNQINHQTAVIPKVDDNTLNKLKNTLSKALDDVSCDESSQCFVISTGSNPCGGASGYAVFSSKTSNQAEIQNTSKEIIQLEKSKHALEGAMGICQHLTEPKGMCKSNQCIAVQSESEVY
ncbi:hypothetical protein [Pseudoalteromonas sp.]|uniref:hypothetical protein n=1 Tax=Pseudoalteromonas sp. TaxID=53249 RepID=UPI00356466FD